MEKQGNYKQALSLYKDYSVMLERYQSELLSHDLLFSDKKHQLKIENLIEIHNRDRIIWVTLCSILGLFTLVGWLYYQDYRSKAKRILTEKENTNLKLEQENLRKEKERLELERDKKILETENLKLEISQLVSERDNLKELQSKLSEFSQPIQDVIKIRLDMLNGLLAKEITNNESYAEPYNKWIETVHNDKKSSWIQLVLLSLRLIPSLWNISNSMDYQLMKLIICVYMQLGYVVKKLENISS